MFGLLVGEVISSAVFGDCRGHTRLNPVRLIDLNAPKNDEWILIKRHT